MVSSYRKLEKIFEKITSFVTSILGNSITFILALLLVIFWFFNRDFKNEETNHLIGDVITSIVFLSLFVIQKTFNHFTASLHVKVNELVSSHDHANNAVINVETKTEHEINQLQKEYSELIEDESSEEEKNE